MTERLIHAESGTEFQLSPTPETMIGRKDPVTGIYPDIDLTPVDPHHSVARRHAKIYRRGYERPLYFLIEEIGTMNETYLNDVRLDTGIPMELHENDRVRCGSVVLQFHPR